MITLSHPRPNGKSKHSSGESSHWARDCSQKKGDDDKGGRSASEKKLHGEGLVSEALTSTFSEHMWNAVWFLDSGASDHMSNRKDWFTTYEVFDSPTAVRIGDGGCIKAYGKGCINVAMFNGKSWIENHLVDVLYVPKLNYNLFSVGIALDKGLEMQSTKTNCELIKDGRIVAMGVCQGKMYVMQFIEPKRSRSKQGLQAYITSISNDMLKDWHEKLAHQNFKHVRQILNRLQISVKGGKDPFCEACTMEKMHRLPFPDSNTKTKDIGEIIHADLCGPMPTKSFGRSRYYLLLKDDYSYYREIYFIESKAETLDRIENFLKKAEKQCPRGVRILRTDNGLEIVNNEMKALTDRLGIRHQRTVAYTPEQNGSAERDNRTLKEAERTLMFARVR